MTGLQKQPISVPFGRGISTKADPKQIPMGNFTSLQNAVFTNEGLLQKRNGYKKLPSTGDTNLNTVTTFKGALVTTGDQLYGFSEADQQWSDQGPIANISTAAQSLVRTASSQMYQDTAVTPDGLACTVSAYFDTTAGKMIAQYQVTDSNTTQVLVRNTNINNSNFQIARVYYLAPYFVIVTYDNTGSGGQLYYTTINTQTLVINPSFTAISAVNTSATNGAGVFEGIVTNNKLYIAWGENSGSTNTVFKAAYLTSNLILSTPITVFAAAAYSTTDHVVPILSVTADNSGNLPQIWVALGYDSGSSNSSIIANVYDPALHLITAGTAAIVSGALPPSAAGALLSSLTTVATGAILSYFMGFTLIGGSPTVTNSFNAVCTSTIPASTGVPVAATALLNTVNIAGKAFIFNSKIYLTVLYAPLVSNNTPSFIGQLSTQPTLYLVDGNTGGVVAKIAAANAGNPPIAPNTFNGAEPGAYPYNPVIPSVYINDNAIQMGYLLKTQVSPVNKAVNDVAPTIYTQSGVNLVTWTFNAAPMRTAELANNLHLSGGILWMYDGNKPVEHGFNEYPEPPGVGGQTHVSTGLSAQLYNYIGVYEWTDNQGNIHQSAPSIPTTFELSGAPSPPYSLSIAFPALALTYKTGSNPVRLVIYRWSTAQPIFYQITSVQSPLINNPNDFTNYTDSSPDSAIVGNRILYTNGGVVENIAAPAFSDMTIYRGRVIGIMAENRNTLWYSKQITSAVPVEFSDLFTLYIPPVTGGQGPSADITAVSTLDDKLIIYKENAAFYITGDGPDVTGANNDFSNPTFIGSTAGVALGPQSLIIGPNGHMFQADKGIWQLGRDLSISYTGAPAEKYVIGNQITSAVMVPETTQIRFGLSNSQVLLYDYFYNQWGQFNNINSISSCIYGNVQAYVDSSNRVYVETPGLYLDDSRPVTMSFTTGWIHAAGLQGYQRAYYFYLLGQYISPHRLSLSIAYDYGNISQVVPPITPTNYAPPYGTQAGPYGSSNYGGPTTSEDWRVFFAKQKCQAFQLSLQEIYDPSLGAAAGAGFNLSGLNFVIGAKKGYRPTSAAHSTG